ncbi:MAG: L-lactate permease [Oscillospiraceae bacterium]|nr:L-lactate permease [Oscillospiraceae bacterium]
MWLAALLPILVLLGLIVFFQWPAYKAAPLSMLTALAVGLVLYKAPPTLIFFESLKGLWSALSIILVVFTAILLFEVTNEAKAFKVFQRGMQRFSPNELMQILLIGWIFTSFLQGITGFGVPVAVGAPLLLGIGVTPLYAVLIPLIGHAWANTFGTLGLAWDSLLQTTGIAHGSAQAFETALWSGCFLWIFNLTAGLVICWLYGKGEAIRKGLPAVLIISAVQGGGQLFLSNFNYTIAAFIPTTICLLVGMLLGRTKWYNQPWRIDNSPCIQRSSAQTDPVLSRAGESKDMSLLQAFVPYILLTIITYVCLAVTPVNELLSRWSISLSLPQTQTGYGVINAATESYAPLRPFVHASAFLLLSSLLGYAYYRRRGYANKGCLRKAANRAVKKALPSACAIMMLLIMSKIMSGSGQTEVLARGTAAALGRYYAIVAPFIGMLGAFMTSSNMASNILFGAFQQTTADVLGLNAFSILGAQTAGGAIGGIISPGNVILGTTTAGISGKEGVVLRRTLVIACAIVGFIGVLLLLVSFFIG